MSTKKKKIKKNVNPVVKDVITKFDLVYETTKLFVSNSKNNKDNKYSAIKGLLISGDAGTGKTHFVKKACIDAKKNKNVKIIKGSVTAPALYVSLYIYREPGNVLMLDDNDIISRSPSERSAIIDMLKAATELTKGERLISWERAAPNPLMTANNVPNSFDFQGSVIWITNDTTEDLQKKLKGHWNAIDSRFRVVPVRLNKQEKLLYTLYLIEEIGMLGKNCEAKEDGYPIRVQNETINYINSNYNKLNDITPRMAIKIADTIYNHPSDWKKYLSL